MAIRTGLLSRCRWYPYILTEDLSRLFELLTTDLATREAWLCLVLSREQDYRVGIGRAIAALAVLVAGDQHQPERTQEVVRLFSIAEMLSVYRNIPLTPVDQPFARSDYDYAVAAVRAKLSETAWTVAWAEGKAMSREQAIAYALGKAE